MINRLKEFFRQLPTSIFYTVINPALVMGLGFLFISGSIKAEQLAEWSGIEFFSLYGLLNYDSALEFSSMFHAFLNEHYLIPPLFFIGMGVLIIRRYRQLGKLKSKKQRKIKAISLAIYESLFLSVILFGGATGNIHALFPNAISNLLFVLGITIPSIGLGLFREKLAENLHIFIESRRIKKN